ncbi:hypothetical protein N8I77_007225 [Diaporthe amygdali]|uniref:F-box domain-containing protein n=1 Tax=Phomopsis amygdali TaxID=1214568 RepID=A0AAD9W1D3_PHOAM|nr:hypothetical protein N8I77_007225 [Diaporthe amygdali]
MEVMEHPETKSTEPCSTDMLFTLPTELLQLIFSDVGTENFRQDVRRLAVCKNWYSFARPILLRNLRLQVTDLRPMVRAMRGNKKLAAAQQMTTSIDLTMDPLPFKTKIDQQRARATANLHEVVSRLKSLDALRTLVIRPSLDKCVMASQVFSRINTLHQLTSLEIDLVGVEFPEETPVHLCEFISQMIPNLKRLRCRLRYTCTALLDTLPGDLEELIINISFTERQESADTFFYFFCFHCGDHIITGTHINRLESRLLEFVESMRNPKMVRLIYNDPSTLNTCAFDAIEQRRLYLGADPVWDADDLGLPGPSEKIGENFENHFQAMHLQGMRLSS